MRKIKSACGHAVVGVLVLVTVLAGGAGEARAVTLASNVGRSIAFHSEYTHYEIDVSENYIVRAQKFSTGSDVAGYTLSSVEVYVFGVKPAAEVKMRICAADLAGAPDTGTCPYTLTNPVTYSQAGWNNNDYDDAFLNIFTAPTNATLSPNTDYFVVFENDGTQATEPDTYSDYWLGYVVGGFEDSGGAAGWSIGDNHYSKWAGNTSWRISSVNPYRIRFNGDVNTGADTIPPNLKAATVDGSSLVLTYNEALDTTSEPDKSDYLVSVDGTGTALSSVAVSGMTVTLTLGTAVTAGQTVG